MNVSLEDDIRERLSGYMAGQTTLEEFHEWFVPAIWDVHLLDRPQAQEMAYDIQLRLAEYTNGDWTEAELRALLARVLASYQVIIGARPMTAGKPATRARTTATARTFNFPPRRLRPAGS